MISLDGTDTSYQLPNTRGSQDTWVECHGNGVRKPRELTLTSFVLTGTMDPRPRNNPQEQSHGSKRKSRNDVSMQISSGDNKRKQTMLSYTPGEDDFVHDSIKITLLIIPGLRDLLDRRHARTTPVIFGLLLVRIGLLQSLPVVLTVPSMVFR
ncbi:hypothetical protein BKA63DRAFT_524367 [Paraphoma chrysanthemicola]|nr:hypothetical protein BKA63DRAFT_524367 [Paraphoma chrysanthemicola]